MLSYLQTTLKNLRETMAVYDQETRNQILSRPAGAFDWKSLIIITAACVILSLLEYYGGSLNWESLANFVGLFSEEAGVATDAFFRDRSWGRLRRLAYWSTTTFIGYFVLPALLVRFVLREPLGGYYLSFTKSQVPFGLTLGLFLIMAPFLVIVAFSESFQSTYPFYNHAERSSFDLFIWIFIYGAQFFALEFFYRGFLIQGLRHRFGIYSILISTIPYVMIHFGKPLPETLGSIAAGFALGAMAYHYRSVWPPIVLHVSIAISMDLFSLSAQGRLPSLFPIFP